MASASVTAIIACYNRFDMLRECLAGLLAQTRTDWKAIVVDDASTDGEAIDVINAIGDSRVTCIRLPENRGPGPARNAGFAQADTPFVLQCDSDDILAPSFFEKTLAVLESDPDVDCVFTNFEMFGEQTGVLPHIVPGSVAIMWQWIHGAGTVLRREVWQRVGGFSEAPELRTGDEDWEFWISAAEQGLKSKLLQEPLYRYRVHGDSITSGTLRYHAAVQGQYIYQKHKEYIDGWGLGAKFLSTSFRKAAGASWQRGERLRAARLAVTAARLAPAHSLENIMRRIAHRHKSSEAANAVFLS